LLSEGIAVNESRGPGMLLIGAGTMLTSMAVAGFLLGYLVDR
jgi:hypothetical protein